MGGRISDVHHAHSHAAHASAHHTATHHSTAHSAHAAPHASHHSHAASARSRSDDGNDQISDGVDARTQLLAGFRRGCDFHDFVFNHVRQLHRLQQQFQYA